MRVRRSRTDSRRWRSPGAFRARRALLILAITALPGVLGLGHVFAQTRLDASALPAGKQRPDRSLLGTTQEPLVRVRLAREAERVTIDAPAHLLVSLDARPGSTQIVRAPIEITRTPRAWTLAPEDGTPHAVAFVGHSERRSPLVVRPMGGQSIVMNGVELPGQLLILPDIEGDARTGQVSASLFHVVEEVGIEAYLPGVIAKELIAGWRPQAFEAQAIAARSYALHERWRSRREERRWDLESSEADQVYGGATGNQRAIDAVSATRGIVLTWEGRILRAYYSSTSGGRSASARDVWPTSEGFEFNLARPIQGYGHDEYGKNSPLYRWTVTRSVDDLTRRLAAYGKDRGYDIARIDELTSFESIAHNQFGRPQRYRIYGRGGKWFELSAEQLRIACNWTGSSGLESVTRKTRVSSSDMSCRRTGDEIVIEGRGFGHGVGLCQYGTQRQAELGRAPQAILMHYYPGATLQRAYY